MHRDVRQFGTLVQLLIRLLLKHPLSSRPQADTADAAPSLHTEAGGSKGDAAWQTFTAVAEAAQKLSPKHSSTVSLSSASLDLQHPRCADGTSRWPTPTLEEWRSIEQVVARACVALDWALLSRIKQHFMPDAHSDRAHLVHQLGRLIQQLLGGHMLDMQLDMRHVFQFLPPLMSAHGDACRYIPKPVAPTSDQAVLAELTIVMLCRLASDRVLLPGYDSATEAAQHQLLGGTFFKCCCESPQVDIRPST